MILNVLYDTETGAVKRWSNRKITALAGEALIEIPNRNLMGAEWRVDLTTKALTEVIPGKTWAEIRIIRDAMLTQTDFSTMPDYPIAPTKRNELMAYRQALRDITTTFKTPDEIVWPVNPLN